jgi:hypothetical protein
MSVLVDKESVVYVELLDRLRQPVRVERAPLAAEPAVWISCEESDDPGPNEPKPLLTVSDARRIRDALDAFIAEHEHDQVPRRRFAR